ncbi:replication-relaxation family protein [Cytobacillus gottheilii]|uniref:replication-relaxation family protein n=1 Tax=Cytobacillus gottheilii TaxID=859144 RepID=UPI002493E792|nr:replication-relaxation family protein [Cytobacillus gottheilii]
MSIRIPLGKGRKRIELKEVEVLLLKEMLIHRIMRSKDIHDFYKATMDRPPHTSSITKRLTRLVNTGVLLRLEEALDHNRPSVKWYYYKLAKKGIFALVEAGWIDNHQAENLYRQSLSTKIPKPHNLALSSLVNTIRLKSRGQGLLYEHFRGGTWLEKQPNDLPFMPDWVFQQEDRQIFIEVDTGAESLSLIKEKVNRYMSYCQSRREEIVIVFSIMDSSVNHLVSSDRSKRIASLKENMPSCQHWPKHLSIYVLSAERTSDLVIRLLDGLEPLDEEYRGFVLEEWRSELDTFDKYSSQSLDKAQVYGPDRITELEVDMTLTIVEKLQIRTIGLLYCEEGSVRSYQKIRYNHRRTRGTIVHGQKFDEVMIIYLNNDALQHDVFGIHLWKNAWLTHRHIWQEAQKEGGLPLMLKPISPYKREMIPFE